MKKYDFLWDASLYIGGFLISILIVINLFLLIVLSLNFFFGLFEVIVNHSLFGIAFWVSFVLGEIVVFVSLFAGMFMSSFSVLPLPYLILLIAAQIIWGVFFNSMSISQQYFYGFLTWFVPVIFGLHIHSTQYYS